jgi:hypothetical protein
MSPILSHVSRRCLPKVGLKFSLRSLMLAVTLCCFAAWSVPRYWEYHDLQLAAAWVQPLASQPLPKDGSAMKIPLRPAGLTAERELEILKIAMTKLPTRRQRMCALKILMETKGPEVRGELARWLPKIERPEIRAAVLLLAALERNEASLKVVTPYLDDHSAEVRAAAATAVGHIHNPRTWVVGYYQPAIFLSNDPPININAWRPQGSERSPAPPMTGIRPRLERMLASVEWGDERAAARGALAFWPPAGLNLRMVELGVLETKQLHYFRAQNYGRVYTLLDDEGPPPEPCRLIGKSPQLAGRVTTKFQTNQPVVVRTGFSHYRPPEARPPAVPVRETLEFNRGLWQVLVSEDKSPWLESASTSGPAGIHNERLRDAAASWISDDEVAERFLHFSSRCESVQAPLVATLTRQTCILTTRDMHIPSGIVCCCCPGWSPTPYDDPSPPRAPITPRIVLLLEIDGDAVSAWETPLPNETGQSVQIRLSEPPTYANGQIHQRIREILRSLGLQDEETDLLLAPWQERFFKPGLRALTILSRADFDLACPEYCLPHPTELVRVGIVLTEL